MRSPFAKSNVTLSQVACFAVLGAVAVSGCGQTQDEGPESAEPVDAEAVSESTTTTTAAVTSTTETTTDSLEATTPSSANEELTNDAEPELRFDIGRIVEWAANADGTHTITFERFERYFDGASGIDLTEEPSQLGTTDVQHVSQGPTLRSFVVSAGAEAFLSNPDYYRDTCLGEPTEGASHDPVDLAAYLSQLDKEWNIQSLVFEDRQVVSLRDQRNC